MSHPKKATDLPIRGIPSIYPEFLAKKVQGRTKRALGDHFGLTKYGVNHTELAPGASSALLHEHSVQEEFIFVLSGHPTLILGEEEVDLSPGMCMGFLPKTKAHRLVNRSPEPAVYLEIGDRSPGDEVTYPEDDLRASLDENGRWILTHKDGTPY